MINGMPRLILAKSRMVFLWASGSFLDPEVNVCVVWALYSGADKEIQPQPVGG